MKKQDNSLQDWATILLGAVVTVAPALLPAQVSLSTVVDLAQRNSSAVKLAEADVQKANASLAQAKDAFVPSLTFGSGLPAFKTIGFMPGVPATFSGTVQSMAISFSQYEYIAAANSGTKAATLNLKDALEQAALDASTAYIELETVDRELDAAHQQEAFASRMVTIEQERAEAGVDPLSDLLQAQLTAAQLKLKRLHLETRAATLAKQLSALTALPVGSITPDSSSIPEIPEVKASEADGTTPAIQSARMIANSKKKIAQGDHRSEFLPEITFNAQYSATTDILGVINAVDKYYAQNIPPVNFSSGFQIDFPLFDMGRRAKAKQSAADALRAKVEAEQAQRQNEVQISELTGSLRELDTLAEIASLKQQIASEQLHAVLAQLELGGGTASGSSASPQLSPKAEQLARIDERQKFSDSLDAGLELSKARLGLLRALGHMQDWLNELHGK
ncbi:MAG TPA: TolC family protein [Terracidiphilus sp.]